MRLPPPCTGSVLARWQRYELDPGYCIDFPAMSDPRQPETAALIKAMKAAERLSAGHRRDGNDAGYGPAVRRLEQALAEAERAAGVNLRCFPIPELNPRCTISRKEAP